MNPHVAQLDHADGHAGAMKHSGRRWSVLVAWVLGIPALLVVVSVVALLGWMAIVNASGRGNSARSEVTYQNMNIIGAALNQYQLLNGNYPPALAALTPKYLEATPVDAWRRPFVYAPVPVGANPYTLYSTGPSGTSVFDYWTEKELRK